MSRSIDAPETPGQQFTVLFNQPVVDVYTWVDEQGTVHFQDSPPQGGRARQEAGAPPATRPAAEIIRPGEDRARSATPQEPSSSRRSQQPKAVESVELYTTTCAPGARVISIGGVAIGVWALTVVLSVMSGFEGDLKAKILGTRAHGMLLKYGQNDFPEWREVRQQVLAVSSQ